MLKDELTRYRLLVFQTAFATLALELLLSRLAAFHLGAEYAYLALPITFLGLAMGSLHVHLRPAIAEDFRPARELTWLAFSVFGSLMLAFVAFTRWLPPTSVLEQLDHLVYLAGKTAVFVVAMLPPFYAFGRIFTAAYQRQREHVGEIYSADFWGAALACAITPVLFHFGGLPVVVVAVTAGAFLPRVFLQQSRLAMGLGVALMLVMAVAAQQLVDWMDGSMSYAGYTKDADVREVAHAWNEHSRVAVIAKTAKGGGPPGYKIIHDNSRSNVWVWPYRGVERRPPGFFEGVEAAWVLGREPKRILVMFAGTGAEMVVMDRLAGGEAEITGVELNALVKRLGTETPELKEFRLGEFLSRPGINLQIDEGRHFLATRPEGTKYDLIYLARNAATTATTGHSRKYLDTEQAFVRYLELLSDDGLLVFDHQPLAERIRTLRRAFRTLDIPDFPSKLMIVDSDQSNDDMIVSPGGFSGDELVRARRYMRKRYGATGPGRFRYVPDHPGEGAYYGALVAAEEHPVRYLTDDKPFLHTLALDRYKLIPDDAILHHFHLYMAWIKVTTVLVLAVLALLVLGLTATRPGRRLPGPVLIYLLLTGFCFMLCEVSLMAKLELFLSEPLLSMAAVLSLFLLTSGIGSAAFSRIRHRLELRWFAPMVAALVVFTIGMLDLAVEHWLGLPVALKLLLGALMIAPLSTSLGVFYPFVVASLVRNERSECVAITYGVSTLSGVVGSVYAMAAMVEVGFNALLYQAAVGYLLLMLVAVVHRARGGQLLSVR